MQFAHTCLMNDCDYDGLYCHFLKLNYCDCMFLGMLFMYCCTLIRVYLGSKYQDEFNPIILVYTQCDLHQT